MVGPNLTGVVCILDTIFIDRNTAGQTNRRKDAQNLTIIYFRIHSSYKMLVNKVLLWQFDGPEENFTW